MNPENRENIDFKIRRATLEDAEKMGKMHVETWQHNYRGLVPDDYLDNLSAEDWGKGWKKRIEHLAPEREIIVAQLGEDIIGLSDAGPAEESPESDVGEVYRLYVHPSNQGEGVGSSLLESSEDFLKQQHFDKAILWAMEKNENALKFYESQGWHKDGIKKEKKWKNFSTTDIRFSKDLKD